ncbi:MAG: methyl-accepting chemotaxis protein [Halobacteriaceae archaeon]
MSNSGLRRLRQSYAAKLAVALLVVVAVLVGVGVVAGTTVSEQVSENVRSDLTTDARLRAGELDAWLTSVKQDVRTTSSLATIRTGDTGAIQSHFDSIDAESQLPVGVVAVHYYDRRSGTIAASTNQKLVGANPSAQGAAFATDPPTFTGPDDTHVTAPFDIKAVDFPIVAVLSPVPGRDAAVVYMVNVRKRAAQLTETSEQTRTVVVDRSNGRYVSHYDPSKIGSRRPTGDGAVQGIADGGAGYATDGDDVVGYASLDGQDWVVMMRQDRAAAFALARTVKSSLAGLVLMGVISLAVVGATIGSSTAISLQRLAEKARQMADGDLDATLETRRDDEIGTLYATFDDLRTSLQDRIAEAEAAREQAEQEREEVERVNSRLEATAEQFEETMRACAAGDLTRRVTVEDRHEAMAAIGREFNAMLDEIEATIARIDEFAADVSTTAGNVDHDTTEMRDASNDVSESVETISEGAVEQTERLEDAAEEVTDLSATAEEIAATVDNVAETSEAAVEAGESGREAATDAIGTMDAVEAETREAVERVEQLDEEVEAINEIVDVIRDIADETNTLALNASIEAARTDAGDGGFAVVADEVKSLAEETKESANDIEERVEDLQAQTAGTADHIRQTGGRVVDGVETVNEALDELDSIVESVKEANAGVQEIADATADQADASQATSQMVDDVAEISSQTAQEAEDAAASAQQQTATIESVSERANALRDRADDLAEVLDEFTVGDESAGAGTTPTDGPEPAAADGGDGLGGSAVTPPDGGPVDQQGGERS